MAWSKSHVAIWRKSQEQKRRQPRYDYRARQAEQRKANELALNRIDAILRDIEAADRESGGIYRDTYDWEPLSVVNLILKRIGGARTRSVSAPPSRHRNAR